MRADLTLHTLPRVTGFCLAPVPRGRAAFEPFDQLARACEQYEQLVHALVQGQGTELPSTMRLSAGITSSAGRMSTAADGSPAPALSGNGRSEYGRAGESRLSVGDDGEAMVADGMTKRHMDRGQLARAWDIQQRTTADDWRDWMRTFSLALLKESPSVALRYCSVIAEHERGLPLRLELFNAALPAT